MEKEGVLLIDKQSGISSAQVLSEVKRKLAYKGKIGHAGTLDPFATGLLLVLLGKATRLADYFQAGEKIYSGEIKFGLCTDSDDVTGSELFRSDHLPEFSAIQEAANLMQGCIEQVPPQISALKIAGKRAYEIVRSGQKVDIAARKVHLHEVSLNQISPEYCGFKLRCSKGFYVRAFARDLGESLNTYACLKSLRREASKPFKIADASLVPNISESNIISWDQALKLVFSQEIQLEDREFNALKNGLVPYTLMDKEIPELDSNPDALIVYRRQSDGLAGGLLCKRGKEIKIALNM